jgi:LysM repeat protein
MSRIALVPVLAGLIALAVRGFAADDEKPDFGPEPIAASRPADPSADKARQRLRRGMDLLAAGKLLDARAELSAVLLSGGLSQEQSEQAAKSLTELADKTLLAPTVVEGDPYACSYTVRQGDLLTRIVRSEKLHVAPEFLLRVNDLADARSLRAGQQIKLIRGPVHAVVWKDSFVMDLYLQREDLPKVFLKRLRVGLGKSNGTPEGDWRVSGKTAGAAWTAPADHPLRGRTLRPGDSRYPLGKDGLWISLEGADASTRTKTGYGIHGTSEPSSIGKAESFGCVRLDEEDIRLAYWLLSEKVSTVQIRQ